MKRRILFCFLLAGWILILLTACNVAIKPGKTPNKLAFENVPEDGIIVGQFDRCGILLRVSYTDGSSTTVPVTESMFEEEYRGLLSTPGTHLVRLTYEKLTAETTVTVRALREWTLTFRNCKNEAVRQIVFREGDEPLFSYPTEEEMEVSGYYFTGQYTPEVVLPITVDTEIYGVYEKLWTVTFRNGSGEVISTQSVRNGQAAQEPGEAARSMPGYVFDGWDAPFDSIIRDTEIHATYHQIPHPETEASTGEPESPMTEPQSIEPETIETEPQSVEPENPVTEPQSIEPENPVTEPQSVEPESPVTEPQSVEPENPVTEPQFVEPENPVTEPQSIEPESTLAEPKEEEPEGLFTFSYLSETDSYSIVARDPNPDSLPTEIVIPESYNGKPVSCIGENAFANCTWLKYVTIPVSITRIEANAFYKCSGVKNFFYEGTENQWIDKVERASSWRNLGSGDVVCLSAS